MDIKKSIGYFDPKQYFPSINITSLDDTSFDDKIKGIYNRFNLNFWFSIKKKRYVENA
jgi:hypothetical protein